MEQSQTSRSAVLIVAEDAFNLGWMGSTQRLFHVARAFQTLGLHTVLIAGRRMNSAVQLEIDARFPGLVIRTKHSGLYPRLVERFNLLRRAWRASWKMLGEDTYWARLSWGWADLIDIERTVNTLNEACVKPVLVWGVSAGYLAGAVAAERLARRLGLPWVFELQDPPRRAGLGPDSDTVKRRFSSLLNAASRVVVTTESYGRFLREAYGLPAEKCRVIHLTYDNGVSCSTQRSDGGFRLVYAGWLSRDRASCALALLKALYQCFIVYPEMKYSVRLDLAGGGPGIDEVARVARKLSIESNTKFLGVLPANLVSDLLACAAAVLVFQATGCEWQIPGKVFEALRVGRPILGIMPPQYEAAEILRRSGLGFVHDPQDIAGIAETVKRIWESWGAGFPLIKPDTSFINQFSLELLAVKLARMLDGIINLRDLRVQTAVRGELRGNNHE